MASVFYFYCLETMENRLIGKLTRELEIKDEQIAGLKDELALLRGQLKNKQLF